MSDELEARRSLRPVGRRDERDRPPSFAVVIPAYDEATGIASCVARVASTLDQLSNRTDLIVVDDGSRDGTPQVLQQLLLTTPRLRAVRHEHNRGYGSALRTGVLTARDRRCEYVLFMDSDLTNDPEDIPRFEHHMRRGVDVIKASRYTRGGGVKGVPWWRVLPSVAGNRLARTLFGLPIHDYTNGFRAVRTELLTAVDLRENGFAIILEEVYRLRTLARSYAEVPIVLGTRADDRRPSSFSYSPRALASFLKFPIRSAIDRCRARLTLSPRNPHDKAQ